jgi:hypothetical protein
MIKQRKGRHETKRSAEKKTAAAPSPHSAFDTGHSQRENQ